MIDAALFHQNRIKFHTIPTFAKGSNNEALNTFFNFVRNILPEDKLDMFTALFRYPIPTTAVTNFCFDRLKRIFDGRDHNRNFVFKDSSAAADWYEYERTINVNEIFETIGFEFFKTEINSILVVDVKEGVDRKPAPYFYFVPIEKVVDYETNAIGKIENILFDAGDKFVYIDTESYATFEKTDGGKIGSFIMENAHNLNSCPATFFWNQCINISEPDIKKSPLTMQLNALDWLLFFTVSKQHLDTYGSYPIYSGYEPNCDYADKEGNYCSHGFLKNKQNIYLTDKAGAMLRCPKCGKKHIVGAGSFVEIPIPADGQPDLKNPVQMLSADVNALKHNVEEIERLTDNIIKNVIGDEAKDFTQEAMNEAQVYSLFESQSSVLNTIKSGFERAENFVYNMMCRLRYGDKFISASVNLGTDFFVLGTDDLRGQYKRAKEAGASESELGEIKKRIIDTETQKNPKQNERLNILLDLENFSNQSLSEVAELYKNGIITESDYRYKANFEDNIKRFERENISISEFGKDLPYSKRIEKIRAELLKYNNITTN